MKKFIIKGVSFSVIVYFIALALQYYIDSGLKKSCIDHNNKEWFQLTHDTISYDWIIMGSSRAWVHISPKMLDSTFHAQSFNMGIDGLNFPAQNGRYLLYRENHKKPSYIVHSVDLFTLSKPKDLYMFEQFVPYLSHSKIRQATQWYAMFDWRDYNIPLYKYIHRHNMAYEGFLMAKLDTPCENYKFKGFQAQDRMWDKSFEQFKNDYPKGLEYDIYNPSYQLFNQYLANCKKEGIQVVMVYTPEYFEAQKTITNRKQILGTFNALARKYDFDFLDYSAHPISNDTLNFYNSQHMNFLGTKQFNESLKQDLERIVARNSK